MAERVGREEFKAYFEAGPWHRAGWYGVFGAESARRWAADGHPVEVRRTWVTDWEPLNPEPAVSEREDER